MRICLFLIGVIGIWVGLEASAGAADWPTWRGDRLRRAVTSESLDLPLKRVWTFKSHVHRASPVPKEGPTRTPYPYGILHNLPMIAANGCVFFSSAYDGRVVCLDAKTAKTKWTFVAGAAVNRSPMYWKGRIYVGSDDGFVYCLDAANGEVKWKFQAAPTGRRLIGYGKMISAWPVRTDVLVDKGVAYFAAGVFPHDGTFVYALDANTGKLLWRNGTQCEDGHQLSLAPGGHLYVTSRDIWVPKDFRGYSKYGYGSPTPFLREDGRFVNGWGSRKDEDSERPKTDNMVFWPLFGVERDGVRYAGDLAWKVEKEEKGRQTVWRKSVEGRWVDFDSAVGVRGKRDTVFRYDPDLCSVILAGEVVYHSAFDSDVKKGVGSGIYARRVQDGEIVWSAEIPDRANQLMVAGGRLFVGTRRGTIYCFAPEKKKVKAVGLVEEKAEFKSGGDGAWAKAAERILNISKKSEGHALVLDSRGGALAAELAQRSKLYVVAVFGDEKAADAARRRYVKAGLHLDRIVAVVVKRGQRLPLPSYFADLVVSEEAVGGGSLPIDVAELKRVQKPNRGVIVMGGKQSVEKLKSWSRKVKDLSWKALEEGDAWIMAKRGALKNGGGWTHFFGDAGNTACSHDSVLKGPLGVAWYGPPHVQQPGTHTSLITNGVLVMPEPNALTACDQYTGRQLWRLNFGSIGVSVAASGKHVYSRVAHVLIQLDLMTGKEKATYLTAFGKKHGWGWFAVSADGKTVYGAAGGGVFATEMESGKGNVKWKVGGPEAKKEDQIHGLMAMSDGRIYVLGHAATAAQREDVLKDLRRWFASQPAKLREEFESQIKERDIRQLTAIDAATGKILYQRGVDVSNCGGKWLRAQGRGYGGKRHYNPYVNIGLYSRNNTVVIASESRADKGWSMWRGGGYAARAITAYDGKSGKLLWYQFTNHRTRPVIINNTLHAEPWAFDLRTGKKQKRMHPITGKEEDWSWCRSDKQCGIFSASSNFLFGRNKGFGYHDLTKDDGLYTFWHSRSNCFVDHVSGGGLMIKPPQAIYCGCQWSLPFTVAMGQVDTPPAAAPFFGQRGRMLPVKHLRLNLGGSGDRRDGKGGLWISPRGGAHWLQLNFSTPRVFYDGGRSVRRSAAFTSIEGTDADFLFATCELGLKRLVIPVTTPADGAGVFRVRLGFAALEGDKAGSRVFDIRLNGKTVVKGFDPYVAAGGIQRAVWKEFAVSVSRNLVVDLVGSKGSPGASQMPILNAVEVIRQSMTSVGLDVSQDVFLSKDEKEARVTVKVANMRDGELKGRLVVSGSKHVKVTPVSEDRFHVKAGERVEQVFRVENVNLESDDPSSHALTVKLLGADGREVDSRRVRLEWLGKYKRRTLKGCTTHVVRRGQEVWRQRVKSYHIVNETLLASRGMLAEGDGGEALTYLDFGTVGDIGKIKRIRLRLRRSVVGEGIHRAIHGGGVAGKDAEVRDYAVVSRVEGEVSDVRRIKIDKLPGRSKAEVILSASQEDPSIMEAELPGSFDGKTRLRFVVRGKDNGVVAFWNKSQLPWSRTSEYIPHLILEYEAKAKK